MPHRYVIVPPNLAAFAGLAIDTAELGTTEAAFPGLAGVRVTVERESDYCTVEASDGIMSAVWTTAVEPIVDGAHPAAKFPDVVGAVPAGEPLMRLRVDVRRLAALARAAEAACLSGLDRDIGRVCCVDLELYPAGANRLSPDAPAPIVIRGETFHGGTFVGLLQPLAPKAEGMKG